MIVKNRFKKTKNVLATSCFIFYLKKLVETKQHQRGRCTYRCCVVCVLATNAQAAVNTCIWSSGAAVCQLLSAGPSDAGRQRQCGGSDLTAGARTNTWPVLHFLT